MGRWRGGRRGRIKTIVAKENVRFIVRAAAAVCEVGRRIEVGLGGEIERVVSRADARLAVRVVVAVVVTVSLLQCSVLVYAVVRRWLVIVTLEGIRCRSSVSVDERADRGEGSNEKGVKSATGGE